MVVIMELYNKKGREEAIEDLNNESFKRITVSFYRYVYLDDPKAFRDELFQEWSELNVFGRIYVAHEGVNAQMSFPAENHERFIEKLHARKELENVPFKYAVDDDGKSFYKLTIKVRSKIVADGLEDHSFDVTNVGNHLSPIEFHDLSEKEDTLVIDMRNHYECEVGKFKTAYCPDADTFREAIDEVVDEFQNKKDQKVLLYCTGGIRCEKASAYLKHHGFDDVNQLHGGIIAYAHDIKEKGLESNFIGKNFVFDQRLGESIDGQVIAQCHQCGEACDNHTNCSNDDCHLLFIQCPKCTGKYDACCSVDCSDIKNMPLEEQKKMRAIRHDKYASSKIFKSRLRPNLMKMINEQNLND